MRILLCVEGGGEFCCMLSGSMGTRSGGTDSPRSGSHPSRIVSSGVSRAFGADVRGRGDAIRTALIELSEDIDSVRLSVAPNAAEEPIHLMRNAERGSIAFYPIAVGKRSSYNRFMSNVTKWFTDNAFDPNNKVSTVSYDDAMRACTEGGFV